MLTILNRDFQHPSDGWYQIEAKGKHPNRAAGLVQVIDEAAASSIVNRFNTEAASGALRHGREMLIDHEHFSDQPDKETRAYGWLQELQNRGDGIYGRIRWTTTGKQAVDGGDYRFFSTEYDPADLQPVKNRSKQVRPLRLGGLSLTNMNNNRGQKPITNRTEFRHGTTAEAGTQQNNKKPSMKNLLMAMGLSAEASEETALAEWSKIKNRLTTAETELTPLKNRVTEIETSNKLLLEEQVDGILAEHGVKDAKVVNRLKPSLLTLKNREDRVGFLADLGYKVATAGNGNTNGNQAKTGKVFNRSEASAPAGSSGQATEPDDDKGRAEKIRNRASELKGAAPHRAFHDCWTQAQRETNAAN